MTTSRGPIHSKIIKDMERNNKTVSGDFSLDLQGILHMTTIDKEKEFTVLVLSKPLSKYVLHKSHAI